MSLDPIISKFPKDRVAVKRLEALINRAEDRTAGKKGPNEYTFEYLIHEVSPSSPEALSLILSELVDRGIIKKLIRVESPFSKGGIAEFPSLLDVPEEIYDSRSDQTIHVEPRNLRVIFKLQHG